MSTKLWDKFLLKRFERFELIPKGEFAKAHFQKREESRSRAAKKCAPRPATECTIRTPLEIPAIGQPYAICNENFVLVAVPP